MSQLEAEAAADLSSAPSDAGMARLTKLGTRMAELQTRIDELDAELKANNIELYELRTKTMVDLMHELHSDHLGLPEAGYDVVLQQFCHANIKADWSEEQREAGFAELDRLEAGDLVKNTITIVFGRNMAAERAEWLEKVRGLNLSFDPPEMKEARAVQWNTLTAFVKEQVKKGTVLDLEKLGATVGHEVVLNKRK